ncbi:MFS transporter [Nocardiopsis sp. NPDC055551]|uniref:MFS transporter n=1 Tax=Nocardiopsis sp. NPDC006832 TaxID=3157188 RepID=UPI0033C69585
MSVDTRNRAARVDRRARIAGAALFLTNGALFANLVPRFPEIKADIGIDNAVYGVAVAAFPAGAFLAGLVAAVLVRRLGSANVAVAGTVLTGLGSIAAGLAPSTAVFMAGLFFAGTMDAVTDVAMHVHLISGCGSPVLQGREETPPHTLPGHRRPGKGGEVL